MLEWYFKDCIEYMDGSFDAVYENDLNDEVIMKAATPAQIERAKRVCQYCGCKGGHHNGCEQPVPELNKIFR